MDCKPRRLRNVSKRIGFVVLSAGITFGAAQAAPPAYRAAVLSLEPALYYTLDEGSGNALNHGALGSTFDGVYLGSVARGIPTLSGDTGVSFDGPSDFIESLASAPSGFAGNPTFTAETVIRIPANGSASTWAPFLHWGPSQTGFEIGRSVFFSFSGNSPDQIFVGFYGGGLKTPAMTLSRDVWHHLVWVRDGTGNDQQGSTLYVDGVDVSSSLVPDPALCCNGTTPELGSTAFRVNRGRDFDGSRYFVGDMDELVLYARALTQEEVSTTYTQLLPEAEGGLLGIAACAAIAALRARRRSEVR